MDIRMTNADWALVAALTVFVVFVVVAMVLLTRGYNSKPKQPKYRNLEK